MTCVFRYLLHYFIRSQRIGRSVKALMLGVCAVWLTACASPTSKIIEIADSQALSQSEVQANGYRHFVLRNSSTSASGKTLHVYLEGDGSPWKYRVLRMRDPTPRQPLMLRLMGMDEAPSVYLGRPCYNGSFADKGCSDDLWTSGRYSEVVVASMTAALIKLQKSYGATELRLFGHSGGGALAILIAERIPSVTHIVTLAGNLDTDAWVEHHNYSPLYGSLNPAKREPLRETVVQWHFMGRRDGVVPPAIVQPYVRAQNNAFGAIIGNFSHGCCWTRMWPSVLKSLEASSTKRLPGMRFKRPGF